MLVDELMPIYDVADAVASDVHAELETTWSALMEVDLIEVGREKPLIALLGALRALPEIVGNLLHGERPPKAPEGMRLKDMTEPSAEQGGWVLLGERENEEIAFGLVGKFWRPVIEYADVPADRFRDFAEPGYAKHVYSLSATRVEPRRTLLRAEMRVATTDEHARKWFRRYWTFGVGSGAHVLISGVLEGARERAESPA